VRRGGPTLKRPLLPARVLSPPLRPGIGNRLVVHPPGFREEVENPRARGVPVRRKLGVSDHAHVIFPYHLEEERLSELAGNGQAIGTTGRGIGPCYQDKVGRQCGIRVGDLLDAAGLRERLRFVVPRKASVLQALTDETETVRWFDPEALCDE